MNILFVTDSEISPSRGGVDRVNYTLAKEFKTKHQINCHLAYIYAEEAVSTDVFANTIKIDTHNCASQLSNYLTEQHIDYVLISLVVKQNVQHLLPLIKKIAEQQHIPVIFWYHNMPGHELIHTNKKALWYRIIHKENKLQNIQKLLISSLSNDFFNPFFRLFLRKKYSLIMDNSDKVVVLSENHIASFVHLSGIKNSNKITAIPNSLSFDTFIESEKILTKQKIVLIVARIDEDSKRVATALKIWKLVEQSNQFNEWKFQIIGTGIDEQYCMRLSKKLNLHSAFFEGRQESKAYYKQSSIFMMTSSNEGFAMTLTEAQQMGVVPIAFNSFGAVHNIITDKYNGLIVPNNNIRYYSEQLMWLMQHSKERQAMANNAVESSKRFTADKIVKQWLKLFEELNC